VTILFDRPGATSLYSGALDDGKPARTDGEASPVHPDVLGFATSFEAWSLGARGCRVATYEGVIRAARGIDTALLDLGPLAGRTIVVPSAPVVDWDGAALAISLGASEWAAGTRTRFAVAPVAGLLDASEVPRSVYDVAALHDAPGRIERLAECLHHAHQKA